MAQKVSSSHTFKVMETQEDGTEKEITLVVKLPDLEAVKEGQRAYNEAFSDAVNSNAILGFEIDRILEERKLWDEEKKEKEKALTDRLEENRKKLIAGGIKLSEGKKIALQMRKDRVDLMVLRSTKNALSTQTAEAQAEQARFNAYMVKCVYYEDGKNYFENLEDYLHRGNSKPAMEAAKYFSTLQYGLSPDFEQKLPENAFLIKYKFMNEDLQLINKDGHPIDEEGRLIDKDNYYVDVHGNRIDREGKPVPKDDELHIEQPFIEDEEPALV
jgi:hypothetical protein